MECPRCGSRNPPEAVRCGFCGYILSKELAIKMEEEKRKREEAIIERIERSNGSLRLC
ncbi:MAG: zinc-ribbon domain-containing protein [Candidatus Freyarchaeota archaeon]